MMAPLTASSRSASSKTMNGALPPSSIEVRFTVDAHCSISILPTAVEPVNVSLRTIGLLVISAPISPRMPATILMTPAGTPARSASSTKANADSGVAFAGLQTTVQPAASAGADLARQHRVREIPGRDTCNNTDRLFDNDNSFVVRRRRNRVAVDTFGLFGKPLDVARAISDFRACLRQRFALLSGHDLRQVFLRLHHQVEPFTQYRCPLFGGLLRQMTYACSAASIARRVSAVPHLAISAISRQSPGLLQRVSRHCRHRSSRRRCKPVFLNNALSEICISSRTPYSGINWPE